MPHLYRIPIGQYDNNRIPYLCRSLPVVSLAIAIITELYIYAAPSLYSHMLIPRLHCIPIGHYDNDRTLYSCHCLPDFFSAIIIITTELYLQSGHHFVPTSSVALPVASLSPVLKVLTLKIATGGGRMAFQHSTTSQRPCI